MAKIVSDRRLYLTADKETVVEHGDTRAAFLLAGEGSEISMPEAERLGLSVEDGRVVYPDAPEAAEEPQDEEPVEESGPDVPEEGVYVHQSGSWYTIYLDGEQVAKAQGEEARDKALEELEG